MPDGIRRPYSEDALRQGIDIIQNWENNNYEPMREQKAANIEDFIPQVVDEPVKTKYKGRFSDAFKEARANGLKVFSWYNPKVGKYMKYTTQLKDEVKKEVRPREVVPVSNTRTATALSMPNMRGATALDMPDMSSYKATDILRGKSLDEIRRSEKLSYLLGITPYGLDTGANTPDYNLSDMIGMTLSNPALLGSLLTSGAKNLVQGGGQLGRDVLANGFIDDAVNTASKFQMPRNVLSEVLEDPSLYKNAWKVGQKLSAPVIENERAYLDMLKNMKRIQF